MLEAFSLFIGDRGVHEQGDTVGPQTTATFNLKALVKEQERPYGHRNIPIAFHLEKDGQLFPGVEGGDFDKDFGRLGVLGWYAFCLTRVHVVVY